MPTGDNPIRKENAKPEHWLYEGTDRKEGDAVEGRVGWEWHGHPARELPGHDILATSNTVDTKKNYSPHAATIYNGPSDNVVFNAGTIESLMQSHLI